jgi:hypothetical protein
LKSRKGKKCRKRKKEISQGHKRRREQLPFPPGAHGGKEKRKIYESGKHIPLERRARGFEF